VSCLAPEMVSILSRGWSPMSEPSKKEVTHGCCNLFAQTTREMPDNKRLVYVGAIGEHHLGQRAPVVVLAVRLDRDLLVEDQG